MIGCILPSFNLSGVCFSFRFKCGLTVFVAADTEFDVSLTSDAKLYDVKSSVFLFILLPLSLTCFCATKLFGVVSFL